MGKIKDDGLLATWKKIISPKKAKKNILNFLYCSLNVDVVVVVV
jgi:hypothetical protein